MTMCFVVIGAARQEALPAGDMFAIVGTLVVLGIAVGVLMFRDRRRRLRLRERELTVRENQIRLETAHRDREEKAHQRQVALSELTAEKLRFESRLLEAQLESADRAKVTRERDDQYHALAMEKIRLEAEALKLQIRELKKRNEDFTSYDDD